MYIFWEWIAFQAFLALWSTIIDIEPLMSMRMPPSRQNILPLASLDDDFNVMSAAQSARLGAVMLKSAAATHAHVEIRFIRSG